MIHSHGAQRDRGLGKRCWPRSGGSVHPRGKKSKTCVESGPFGIVYLDIELAQSACISYLSLKRLAYRKNRGWTGGVMKEVTEKMASVQPHHDASTTDTLPVPTGLTAAFMLKGVRQVKAGITVVDGIELAIPHGEIIALVGPSGAGKTSLLRLLNRLDDPVGGEIFYRARHITQYPVQELRRKVGFVFQTPV